MRYKTMEVRLTNVEQCAYIQGAQAPMTIDNKVLFWQNSSTNISRPWITCPSAYLSRFFEVIVRILHLRACPSPRIKLVSRSRIVILRFHTSVPRIKFTAGTRTRRKRRRMRSYSRDVALSRNCRCVIETWFVRWNGGR